MSEPKDSLLDDIELIPGTPSERAARHLQELTDLASESGRNISIQTEADNNVSLSNSGLNSSQNVSVKDSPTEKPLDPYKRERLRKTEMQFVANQIGKPVIHTKITGETIKVIPRKF